MSEMPWSKFFWSDWEADQGLRLCSLAAQGLWMRILCVCAKGDPRGYLAINGSALDSTDVARLCGVTAEEVEPLMEELSRNGVFSRDRKGRVFSRRMVRDAKKSATGKKFAKQRWSQDDEKNGEIRPPNGSPNGVPTTQKPEARSQTLETSEIDQKSNSSLVPTSVKPRPFPADGSIAFSPWADVIRDGKPGADVDVIASAFRRFCRDKDIDLDARNIEQRLRGFCKSHNLGKIAA